MKIYYKIDQDLFSYIFDYFKGNLPKEVINRKNTILVTQEFVNTYKKDINKYILEDLELQNQTIF